jgi:hypothetical protein
MMYGDFQPTIAPTTSRVPTASPAPTISPTTEPTLDTPETTTAFNDDVVVVDQKIPFDAFLVTLMSPVSPDTSSSSWDRSELLRLTEQHLTSQLQDSMANSTGNSSNNSNNDTDNTYEYTYMLKKVTLGITGVKAEQSNFMLSHTEAIQGHVVLNMPEEEEKQVTAHVQQLVQQAMTGDSLDAYTALLQTANNTVLQNTVTVLVDFEPTASDDDTDNDQSSVMPFEWNAFWIAVVLAGTAVFLGLMVLVVMLYRNKQRRHWEQKTIIFATKTSQSGEDDDDDGNNNNNNNNNNESSDIEQGRRKAAAATSSPSSSPLASKAVRQMAEDNLDDLSDDEQSHAGRYPASEVTSCYSYIESNNSMIGGDQSYSVAPSLMYGVNLLRSGGVDLDDEEQTVESRLWSVADGIAADGSVMNPNLSTASHNFPKMVNAAHPGANFIYTDNNADDDDYDDLSLVSERAMQENIDVVGFDDRLQNHGTLSDRAQWDISKVYAQGSSDESDEDEDDDDDTVSEVGQKRLPFDGLSLVEEGSSASDMESSVSSYDTNQGKTVQRANMGTSYNENALNMANADRYDPMESSDDDSSIFMGPSIMTKSAQPLSQENKLSGGLSDPLIIKPPVATIARKSLLADNADKENASNVDPSRGIVEADEDSDQDVDDSFLLFFPTPYVPKQQTEQVLVSDENDQ